MLKQIGQSLDMFQQYNYRLVITRIFTVQHVSYLLWSSTIPIKFSPATDMVSQFIIRFFKALPSCHIFLASSQLCLFPQVFSFPSRDVGTCSFLGLPLNHTHLCLCWYSVCPMSEDCKERNWFPDTTGLPGLWRTHGSYKWCYCQ